MRLAGTKPGGITHIAQQRYGIRDYHQLWQWIKGYNGTGADDIFYERSYRGVELYAFILDYRRSGTSVGRLFDSTLGYPGEGPDGLWSPRTRNHRGVRPPQVLY